MEDLKYWRARKKFTVNQASLLIVGEEAASAKNKLESQIYPKLKDKCEPIRGELIESIEASELSAKRKYKMQEDNHGKCKRVLDCNNTTILKKDIKAWLIVKEIDSEVFCVDKFIQAGFLNSGHERYAPKLAAAVSAWLALEDETLLGKKKPFTALENWLTQNASKYNKDTKGVFTYTAIQECARVANWNPEGGAPKTPS